MRIRTRLFAALALLFLVPSAAWTSGPVVVNEAGQPLVWDLSGGPVPFNPDQGALGQLDNDAATALVVSNFSVWEAVPTSSIAFSNAGTLPVDVNASNVFSFLGVCEGLSPVIYDTDGSIVAALLGPGAENFVLGFAGPECGSLVPPVITESVAILNGRWIDGIETFNNREIPLAEFSMVFLHEFGHSINLDHTQINVKQAFDGDPSNDAAIPTMFPLAVNGIEQASLHRDDIASVSTLYPEAGFLAGAGTITGTIVGIDGITAFQGANVIARNVANPLEDAVSNVSGARYVDDPSTPDRPPSGLFGLYEIHNLTPGASYTIEIEQIDPDFAGGSSVGPISVPFALPGPPEFWSGSNESNSDPPDDSAAPGTPIPVTAGVPVSNINILMNDIFTESNEANDDFGTATATACSATRLTKLDPAGDVDFYRFIAPAGTLFTADVEACRLGSFDALLGLFDNAGTLLTFNDDFDGLCPQNGDRDPMIPFFPLPPSHGDVYYVAVTGFNPDFSFARGVHPQAGPYKLNLSCEAPLPSIPRTTDSRRTLYLGDIESLRGVKALADIDGDGAADAQNIFASGGGLDLVNELDFDRNGRLLATQVFSPQVSLLPDVNRDFFADSVRPFLSPLNDGDAMRVQPGSGVVFLGDAGAAICCGFPGDIVTMHDADGDGIPETSTTFATQMSSVVSLDFSPSGRLYAVDVVEGVIRVCSDQNHDYVADTDPCPVFSNAVPGTVAIRVDAAGRVFAVEARTSRIQVLQDIDDDGVADGPPSTFAKLPRGFVFDFGPSNGITFGPDGKLYILARDQTLIKNTFSAFQDVLAFEDADSNLVADGPPMTFARAVSREAAGLVFGADPPVLPPLSIKARVSPSGSVVPKTGVVTIEGTVTCSRPAVVSIVGRLEQKHARMTVKGSFSASVSCDGKTPWKVTVEAAPVAGWPGKRFEPGKAKVIASASAPDVATGEDVRRKLTVDVKLVAAAKRR